MPIDGPLMAIDGPHGIAMAIDELRWDLSTGKYPVNVFWTERLFKKFDFFAQKNVRECKGTAFKNFWNYEIFQCTRTRLLVYIK